VTAPVGAAARRPFITAAGEPARACLRRRPPAAVEVARSDGCSGCAGSGQLNAHIPSFRLRARARSGCSASRRLAGAHARGAEIRLEIRYRPHRALRRRLSDTATLYLDIVDYPGEWLLDLPLLELDSRQVERAGARLAA